ncbi:MAG: glycoside hydrolase family 10 protein [Fimbriimonadales bacterium]
MLAILAAAMTVAPVSIEVPAMSREFRAVWVATVANIDWPSKPGIPTSQAKQEMLAILDKCKAMHLNAVIWQVRPCADAIYPSKLEPWSPFLTGRSGKAPDPYWDPLEFGIKEAHKRGIEFHCWFNPFRAKHSLQKGEELSMDHISNAMPEIVKHYGDFLWMDPGEKETQRHTLAVIMDVVKRYDVDGIHIDDYFYPYKSYAKGADFPDDHSYTAYQNAGGKMAKDDWRRANVDTFIQDTYEGIHRIKPWVKFGISPFGIYRPGHPRTVKAGMDQYADLYADPLKWLQKGWCDYLTPQLYWKINSEQPYKDLLDWWGQQNTDKRNLWPGNYTSKTDPKETEGAALWPAKEIIDQVELTRQEGATGNVHFSMRALMHNAGGISDDLAKLYAEPALVPASPWLGESGPRRPNLRPTGDKNGGQTSFFWSPGGDGDSLRWVCIYSLRGATWSKEVVSADRPTVSVSGSPSAVVVTVVDRVGNESAPAAWPAKYAVKWK